MGVDALLYPTADRAVADAAIHDVLQKVGLRHLGSRLDEDDQWASILSGGEQQRLAFARLLLNPPDIVIMDEATAALDEVSQARMLEFIRSDLSQATVINVAHRPGLEEYHNREIHLVRVGRGPAVARDRHYPRLRHMLGRLVRSADARIASG